MVGPGRDKLSGVVEVYATFVGGMEVGTGNKGRGKETKALAVVATESIGKQTGRVRFRCIDEASSKNLIPFIKDSVSQGSTIVTDGWTGYKPLQTDGRFKHEVQTVSGSGKEARELLPHVHMIDSLLKGWLKGTHQGKVSPKDLLCYLDEFAFRFNRKMSTFRGRLFYRLMQQAIEVEPTGLNDMMESQLDRKA